MRTKLLFSLSLLILLFYSCQPEQKSKYYDIRNFGASTTKGKINTEAIQAAIDKAHENGGGTVLIADGTYMSGTIFLKDHVSLKINSAATLLGSPDIEDYTEITWGHNKDRQPWHLIVAKNAKHVSIKGKGLIDGNGEAFWKEYEKDEEGNMVTPRWIMAKDEKVSPLIEITDCKHVDIEDVTIKTGGGWNLHFHNSEMIRVDGINIENNIYSPNSDGIDVTGCTDVMINNCYIRTGDDAVCLKTTPDSKECHRVTVTNCVIETLCVGLKLGATESYKDMSHVTFSNCVINKSSRAVGLYVREGARVSNIAIDNIVSNTNAPLIFNRPLHIMVEQRTPESKLGSIHNVHVNNFISTTEGRILLTAQEGSMVENIILSDITLEYPMIENPEPFVEGSGSSQFPKPEYHPGAMGAKAAIIADNIKNLVIDNLLIKWPGDTMPEKWKHPERIENGSMRIHKEDYSNPRQTEFSVLWGKRLKGGFINAPAASSSDNSKKKYQLTNSNIQIIH